MIVLNEFQKMFDEIVIPYLDKLDMENEFLEPLFYTLKQKSNKFRSATALLSTKICGGNYEETLPVAAVSELIHSSIIIQDDIADDDFIRRGKKAAWKKYGTCYALHSSVYIVPLCLELLSLLKSPHALQIKNSFLLEYQYVYKSQIKQVLLELSRDMSYDQFWDVHMGKTAIGRWAITAPALFYGKNQQVKMFEEFARKLGDAGSIKNDIEDFIEDDDYEPFCSDIRKGRLTYPIYYYFSKCNSREKKDFLIVFGRDRAVDCSDIRQKILDKGAVLHTIKKINRLVSDAIYSLKDIPFSDEKQLLIAWANSHNYSQKR